MSIAACYNVARDAKALRGALEAAQGYFDNIYVLLTPIGGVLSPDDETPDLLREFGIEPKMGDIQQGYGVIRTRLIHECGCEWAFIMDADERFRPTQEVLKCHGDEKYPEQQRPNLRVEKSTTLIYPGQTLKELIKREQTNAVMAVRRHWFDFSHKHPAQNWHKHPDWQLRIVRNRGEIGYDTSVRMHERLIDTRTGSVPEHAVEENLFFDHYHLFFRLAYPGHKETNEVNYSRLERGEPMVPFN